MIINTLMNNGGLAHAFSRYIPLKSKYQYKLHVVATKAGFKNWDEFQSLLGDQVVQGGIRGVESFWESETPSLEEIHEGIGHWLSYMLTKESDENFKSYTLLKMVALFYFVVRNDDFTKFYDQSDALGFSNLVNVPLLSGFNLWSFNDSIALRTLNHFFNEYVDSFLSVDGGVELCRSLKYLAVTIPDGVKLMCWEVEHGKRSHLNDHVYSTEHDTSYYLKVYSGDPIILVCDDDYPEGLNELCRSLGVLYAGDTPLPCMNSTELIRLGMKKNLI